MNIILIMAKILRLKGNIKRKSLNVNASLHKELAKLALECDRSLEDLANEAIAQFLISEDVSLTK
ncbi:hypothetical protein [Phormidium tenue]|jgi:hypothetical protein